AQVTQAAVEPDAADKRRGEKGGERHFDYKRNGKCSDHGGSQKVFVLSARLMAPSMRTATDEPMRPMRPLSSGTPPQRSSIGDSGPAFSMMVWPTSSFMMRLSGRSCSSRMASISTRVDHSSVARWLSQMESRPNFSPMN